MEVNDEPYEAVTTRALGAPSTRRAEGVLLHLGSYWFSRMLGTVTPDSLWSLKSGPPLPLHGLRTT